MRGISDGSIDLEKAKELSKDYLHRETKASKRYLSEDYYFCANARKLGLHVWLCPWMKLQHAGSYVFGGSLADLAQLGAAATADIGEMQKIRAAEKKRAQK
jgi:hypothetical protein